MKAKTEIFDDKIRGLGLFCKTKSLDKGYRISLWFVALDQHRLLQGGDFAISVVGKQFATKKYTRIFSKNPFTIIRLHGEVPYEDILSDKIHNKLEIIYRESGEIKLTKPVIYSLLWLVFKNGGKSKSLKIFEDSNTTMYFRQSVNNWVHITQRRRNKSDDRFKNFLIYLAFYCSILLRWKRIILLYEKESEKYEESASVVFEKLIDKERRGVYFILDTESKHNQFVPKKYKKYILKKHSFKHYLYFFISRTFLGTEMPSHAIDLRITNKHAVRKIYSKKINYVFLQHGVMFFIALSSKAKHAARKFSGVVPLQTKTVVSSHLEAKHFVEHGEYDYDDLYISGLPKFDETKKDNNADKVVIMPTWRPWEYNQIRIEPEKTRYYKMLAEIIEAIPEKLKPKVCLLPHPLFIREVKNTELGKYIKDFDSYDKILRQTDTLITDYSSVSADAFYRGAKVIFWWKEKDYCMEQYGGDLMINSGNIFGDIVMNKNELQASLESNYKAKQSKKYIERYRKINEFHDGKNTQRLIDELKQDKII